MKRLIFLALVAACSAPPLPETAEERAALGQPCMVFVQFCPNGGCKEVPACPGRDECALTGTDPRIVFTCQFPVEGGE